MSDIKPMDTIPASWINESKIKSLYSRIATLEAEVKIGQKAIKENEILKAEIKRLKGFAVEQYDKGFEDGRFIIMD